MRSLLRRYARRPPARNRPLDLSALNVTSQVVPRATMLALVEQDRRQGRYIARRVALLLGLLAAWIVLSGALVAWTVAP